MKKIALSLLAGLFAFNVHADTKFSCDYTDKFLISDNVDAHIGLMSYNSIENLEIIPTSPRSFTLHDVTCKKGQAYVAVGLDMYKYCNFIIADGPYMWSPQVISASCKGMNFRRLSSMGSHSYVIELDEFN
ncbi:hypothetical protein BN59_00141 [Legionella massiliensis]|uniref:Uncharacterized protein n=1 Tax=Legionella massiliensis TaxID=1034943 RepID=A0A078KS14_9GAMM|nr:hypothetical protein [Legionella massiliensis]CDZ75881.1 hypothetical protein BN59_00141 [Legionella massiliensis]CEE11619.1 hypothetical protein BN1094_00141 [Legionella massiliensis]